MRDFHLIREVSRQAPVVLCSLAARPEDRDRAEALRGDCVAVEVFEPGRRSAWEHLGSLIGGSAAGRPLAMHPFFFPRFATRIRELIVRHRVDILQVEHSILAGYREAVPPGHGCRTILSFHNVASRQYGRLPHLDLPIRERLLFRVKARLMRRWEARHSARFDHCLVVSPAERDLLHREDPSLPITVVENGVDARQRPPLDEAEAGNALLFVGVMGYEPNEDAARYFCGRILPLVEREVPDVRLLIVGHAPREAVRRLADRGNVTVTGSVKDVLPYYRRARVSVVPLRAGGGTRLKILESMALGRPVVSTSIGCEGLAVEDGVHLLVADDPETFARRVIGLLRSPERRTGLALQARRLVEEHYDWAVIGEKLLAVYRRLMDCRIPQPGGVRS